MWRSFTLASVSRGRGESFLTSRHLQVQRPALTVPCSPSPIQLCSQHPVFPPRFRQKVMDPLHPPLRRYQSDFFFHPYISGAPIVCPCVQPCFWKTFQAQPPGQWLPQGWEELASSQHAFHSGTNTTCQAHRRHTTSVSLFPRSVWSACGTAVSMRSQLFSK